MYAKKSISLKTVAVLLAVVLLLGGAVGGTLAWLMMKTDPIVNTFTTSDVTIKLEETKPTNKTAKMVPGTTIDKDPKVSVDSGSESCWLFVKVVAENGVVHTNATGTYNAATDYITYTIADGWTPVPGETNVYYRTVADNATEREFSVLAGDKVSVLSTVTKAMMTSAKTNAPTLTFTAYAVQQEGFSTAEGAWAEAKKLG